LVEKVRVKNRHDCCGERLTGTKITIGGQFCGTIPATGQGKFVEVKCAKPLFGGEIQLTTTRNEYLQINSVECYGWNVSKGSSSTVKTSSYNVPANTKVSFDEATARQSDNYNRQNTYPASNAFSMGPKFTHTQKGVGKWWEVRFRQGYWVDRVRVLNRKDCCGARLDRTKVFIDNQYCGAISGKANGTWYTVKCNKPLFG